MTTITGSNVGKTLGDVTIPVSQRVKGPDLKQQDFLKIMIQQLKSQNPLEPSDGNEFFGQMVQFQSLDAMTAMQKAIENLTQIGQLSNATSLIGKTVTAAVSPGNDEITGMPKPKQLAGGKVLSVTFGAEEGAVLHLDSNVSVPASTVMKVQ